MSDDRQPDRPLKSRHVSMISIGGIIGSGLFVGSSAAIAATGPAIVISYAIAGILILLVMRMLADMALAAPGAGSFTEHIRIDLGDWAGFVSGRSEEHMSELQSLMRISYAVFCVKKKKQQRTKH